MIQAIKEICIFMLIAQAVLFFVPGGAYMKYVRILAGILVILRVTEPLIDFAADEKTEMEMQEKLERLFATMEETEQMPLIEDGSVEIYHGIEEELRRKLAQCENDYVVRTVTLDAKEGMVVVTVQSRGKEERTEGIGEIQIDPVVLGSGEDEKGDRADGGEIENFAELKRQYGECIGMNPENILVKQSGGRGGR